MKWLFLRGDWDRNNRQALKDNTDFWVQLFRGIAGDDDYYIWYKGRKNEVDFDKVTHVFSRGGHEWQDRFVKKCIGAYKIYYGAGVRVIPKNDLYDLILVDCEEDLKKCRKKYPDRKVEMWIKPAAEHFKPVECGKKYDICYIADCSSKFQEKIKGLKWMYKTVPRDLKVLHLGQGSLKQPKNVKVKRVPRKQMPEYISKCRLGVVCYSSYDSAPRAIPEMLACDVPVLALDCVRTNWKTSPHFLIKAKKETFWKEAKDMISLIKENWEQNVGEGLCCTPKTECVFYEVGIYDLEHVVKYLRNLIKGG